MMNSNSLETVLRPAADDDREFLLHVYECSRETELSMVPWDEKLKRAFVEHQFDAQTAHYSSTYPAARHDIVILAESEERVGRLYVNRSPTRISILDITILPQYRQRGIGSSLIAEMIQEASRANLEVQVYVETFNPSLQFFKSRGFAVEDDDGMNFRLVWRLVEKQLDKSS